MFETAANKLLIFLVVWLYLASVLMTWGYTRSVSSREERARFHWLLLFDLVLLWPLIPIRAYLAKAKDAAKRD